jgi:hypothetical protein
MLQPCSQCPFQSDRRFGLTSQRCEEIADGLLHDRWFPCHKTIDLPKQQPCIGAVRFLENVTGDYRSNVTFRLAMRHVSPEGIDRTIPVYQSKTAFIEGASR